MLAFLHADWLRGSMGDSTEAAFDITKRLRSVNTLTKAFSEMSICESARRIDAHAENDLEVRARGA